MAVYNEILAGRFNRALQKLLSMKGAPPAPQLGGEVVPSIPLFYGREARYLETWDTFGGEVTVAAVAANQSAGRIFNPAGSNTVAVIEKVLITVSAADTVQFMIEDPAVASSSYPLVGSQNRLDLRSGASSALLVQGKNNNATTFGTQLFRVGLGANTPFDFIVTDIQELPLLPGSAFNVTEQVGNTALNFSVLWRQRPLEDSELK